MLRILLADDHQMIREGLRQLLEAHVDWQVCAEASTGREAVELALKGHNAVMPAIVRKANKPYKWGIKMAQLADVANREKFMPREFITADGFGITPACRRYLAPLIQGEDYPPYKNGVPDYVRLKNLAVKRKLKNDFKL